MFKSIQIIKLKVIRKINIWRIVDCCIPSKHFSELFSRIEFINKEICRLDET